MDKRYIALVKDSIDLYIQIQELEGRTRALSTELDKKVGGMTASQRRAYDALKAIGDDQHTPGSGQEGEVGSGGAEADG